MIEKQSDKLYLKCDYCKKEILWKDFTTFDLLRKSDLPTGWQGYKEGNLTKMIFCPDNKCQQALNLLTNKINIKEIVKENWMTKNI
jgi:hypothetical protein